jgi:hypothetical protein
MHMAEQAFMNPHTGVIKPCVYHEKSQSDSGINTYIDSIISSAQEFLFHSTLNNL